MTKTEKSASSEKLKWHIGESILLASFLILFLWFGSFYDASPSLGAIFGFFNVSFIIIFATWGDYAIQKYGIIDQINSQLSQLSSKSVRGFVSMSILTACIFWTGIVGILAGSLLFFSLNYILL